MQVEPLFCNETSQAIPLGHCVLKDTEWHMLTLTMLRDAHPLVNSNL